MSDLPPGWLARDGEAAGQRVQQMRSREPLTPDQRIAAQGARIAELETALREAKDGLRYWEPRTSRGRSEYMRITALVDAALAGKPGA